MKPKAMLIAALGLGLLTAAVVYVYVGSLARPQPALAPTVPVVVAVKAIDARSPLAADAVTVRQVPEGSVVPGALRSLPDALGRVARYAIAPGAQITDALLFPKGVEPGLAFVIPPGKRAVTVAVDEVKGVAGFIKPGDHVDVIATFAPQQQDAPARSVTVLQDTVVLAVAQSMEDDSNKAKVSTSVTLAVSPTEAEKLALATEQGVLRLALRPAEASGISVVPSVATSDLVGAPAKAPAVRVEPLQPARSAPPVEAAPAVWHVEVIRGSERTDEAVRP